MRVACCRPNVSVSKALRRRAHAIAVRQEVLGKGTAKCSARERRNAWLVTRCVSPACRTACLMTSARAIRERGVVPAHPSAPARCPITRQGRLDARRERRRRIGVPAQLLEVASAMSDNPLLGRKCWFSNELSLAPSMVSAYRSPCSASLLSLRKRASVNGSDRDKPAATPLVSRF